MDHAHHGACRGRRPLPLCGRPKYNVVVDDSINQVIESEQGQSLPSRGPQAAQSEQGQSLPSRGPQEAQSEQGQSLPSRGPQAAQSEQGQPLPIRGPPSGPE